MTEKSAQIVILGMHRSGTSVVTRLTNLMGAYFGSDSVHLGYNEENERGFWERTDVMTANKVFLRSVDRPWPDAEDYGSLSFFDGTVNPGARIVFEKSMNSILETMNLQRPWVVKDPRFCLTAPALFGLLDAPICVHVIRHPVAVAFSMRHRTGIPIQHAIGFWEMYNISALRASDGLPRLIVDFDKLCSNPVEETNRYFHQLRQFTGKQLSLPRKSEIEGYFSGKLVHHRNTADLESDYLTTKQANLHHSMVDNSILEGDSYPDLSNAARELIADYEKLRSMEMDLEKVEAIGTMTEAMIGSLKDDLHLQLEGMTQAMQQRLDQLEQQLRNSESGYQEHLEILNSSLVEEKSANQAHQEQIRSLEQQTLSLQQSIASLNSDLEQAVAARNELQGALEQKSDMVRQLAGLVDQLDSHLRVLFSSATWNIGYKIMQAYRKACFWKNRAYLLNHMTPSYFRNMVETNPAYRLFAQEDGVVTGHVELKNSINGQGLVHDIEVALQQLWRNTDTSAPYN